MEDSILERLVRDSNNLKLNREKPVNYYDVISGMDNYRQLSHHKRIILGQFLEQYNNLDRAFFDNVYHIWPSCILFSSIIGAGVVAMTSFWKDYGILKGAVEGAGLGMIFGALLIGPIFIRICGKLERENFEASVETSEFHSRNSDSDQEPHDNKTTKISELFD